MQLENKIYCHWDLVRFLSEEHQIKEDGTFLTLSVIDGKTTELMIFLGKNDSNSCYEVRVYKYKADDKYIPNEHDHVKSYEENDEYATFLFDEYEDAHEFVDNLGYMHSEYKARPVREIEIDD